MRRKFYLLAIVTIIAFIGFVSTDSSDAYVCGDANSDGSLNVSDAVYIINYVFVGGPAPDPDCCHECPPVVIDVDGNVYQTVPIGDQCWMAENLKVTHYRNGDPLSSWWNYDYDEANGFVYGKLYNWYVIADSRGIAPEGWHVPSDAEWQTLVDYLGGEAIAGGKMKEMGTFHWNFSNAGATNESGFTGLPGGMRIPAGTFHFIGELGTFWSSTESDGSTAWFLRLIYNSSSVLRTIDYKNTAYSIRCVKD